ncbi:hypothetical protein BDQ17DRAFT_1359216 [Cyathus striatus]|nr:hypothetical protein BDQ17DRAFT_1359216 [Cyathus striatus]
MAIDEEKTAAIKAMYNAKDEQFRESWVRAMEARIVREELQKCQQAEGVNHLESCKWLAEKYLQKLRENKEQGYKPVDSF